MVACLGDAGLDIAETATAKRDLVKVQVLPLDLPSDTEYGGIRSELEATGRPICGNDLLIAAHARAIHATIVTPNTDGFERFRGPNVENWPT